MGTREPHKQINQSLKQARSDILYNLGHLLFAVPHSYIQSFEADLNAYGNRHMVFFYYNIYEFLAFACTSQ